MGVAKRTPHEAKGNTGRDSLRLTASSKAKAHMRIADSVDEVTTLEASEVSKKTGKQRIRRNVKWNTQTEVC